MTWARLDDRTSTRPEWVGLANAAARHVAASPGSSTPAELHERARQLAQRAKAVHLTALMYSVPALTDGRLTPADAEQICAIGSFTPPEFYDAADLLVATGAWAQSKPSKRDPLGAFTMRLGWSPGEQPLRADEEIRRKRNALRDALREGRKDYPNRLRAEERSEGLCEYCDASIGRSGQIDHIDPEVLTNDLENLAHCCARCNKKKGGILTLEQAGMAFTPRAIARRQAFATTREQGR